MEKSKPYKDVLELGRMLVEELDLEKSVDTLGRWMVHHISELIAEAEKTEGGDIFDVEDRCREAILSLWKHISVFPREHRPLENIEPLLATIQALDPENEAYFYQSEAEKRINQSTLSDQAKEFLELSLEVDYSARLIVDMCLKYAANEISNEKRDLLDLAQSLGVDTPQILAVRLMTDVVTNSDEEQEVGSIREAIKTFTSQRERLKGMVALSERLISSIDEDINNMEHLLRD